MPATERRVEPVKKFFYFTVVGKGEFPSDMLRYDQCWPQTEAATHLMLSNRERRQVNLVGLCPPTELRWKSFQWQVL